MKRIYASTQCQNEPVLIYRPYRSDYNIHVHPLNSENRVSVLSGLSENKVTANVFFDIKLQRSNE